MDIESFKKLTLEEKLKVLRFQGNLVGPYERNAEQNGTKVPGDIYEVGDFWVYLSDDEKTVVPSRRNPIPHQQ